MSEARQILEDLATSEDDFDVDLMASGCRLPRPQIPRTTAAQMAAGPEALVLLYRFDAEEFVALISALVGDGKLDLGEVFSVAEDILAARSVTPEHAARPSSDPA